MTDDFEAYVDKHLERIERNGPDTISSLRAEVERLRAALRKIVDLGGAYGSAEYTRQADRIARTALEKETSA